MTPTVLLAAVALAAPPDTGYEVVVRKGEVVVRLELAIDTPAGPFGDRQKELLGGWVPTADGSGPLDPLVPDGQLLRTELAPPSPHAEILTRALVAALDADGDGVLSRAELTAAPKVLLERFDADGDECLTPLELAPDLLTAVPKAAPPGWSAAVLRPGEPRPRGLPESAGVAKIRTGTPSRTVVRDRRSGLAFDVAVASPEAEPAVPKAFLRPGRETDRDRFAAVAREVVTLSVRPQPRGWFELLDTDGDGQLSVRELQAAWAVLADDQDTAAGSGRSPDPAAPAVCVTLTPGVGPRPAVRLAPLPKLARGPVWFRGLDRNRDGDVSRKEFIGTDEQFRRYDADGDGLISADEAAAGDRKLRAGGKP